MKTKFLLQVTAFTALLALTAHPVLANGAPPRVPYRRPAQLQQPIEPTSQAHLEAAQDALRVALDLLTTFSNQRRGGSGGDYSNTINYGGYVARAQEDLRQAIIATTEGTTYVSTHPEINALAAGPVPANELKTPPLPQVPDATLNASNLMQAVDAVVVAMGAVANNPARDYHGPILGDLGGHRATIIAAIARVGRDLNDSFAYYHNTRGGSTGIIPLSDAMPTSQPADPKYGPTVRLYLEQVQTQLTSLTTRLGSAGSTFTGDQTQGGNVAKVEADLQRMTTDLTDALAYVDKHPEANVLQTGPAGPEPSKVVRATVTGYRRGGGPAPKLTPQSISVLNTMLGFLQNISSQRGNSSMLGDIGGHRGKLMDDIGQAMADTQAGIEFTAKDPTAPPPAPIPVRRGSGPASGLSLPAPAPGAMLDPQPAPTTDPSPLPGPAGMAGLALSLGVSLSGLFLLARKK